MRPTEINGFAIEGTNFAFLSWLLNAGPIAVTAHPWPVMPLTVTFDRTLCKE